MKSPQGIALISRPEPPLGAEPWGFVPWEVGNPPTWRNFYNDSRDPWWMDEDTFDTKEKFSRAVRRLKWLHNSTTFSAQGGHTRYRDWQGEEHTLRPTVSAHRGVYGIRSFHQIHCIIVITDDYGRRIHGLGSQWTPGHVMHCINVLRQLIQCMADTSLVSFAHSPHGHLGDGQQMWCRRFDDIKEWASEPERGTSLRLVSPPEQLFEVWDEITPYPGREPLPDDWK
ncbi:hypothetical protein LZ30DRAFT_611427 [Colletotrichum cereale]|nr:hypothetical protein LZ30DRAFT_611427 [Colletotrichum cereale]